MNDFTTQFKKQAERITLSEAERSGIRHAVLGAPASIPSPFSFPSLFMSRGFAVALSLVLIVSGAGSTLYAAESALPGDPLYSIKTDITEPLTRVLVLSDEGTEAWHERIATRRLSEAEALAKEGRLDEEKSRTLAIAFMTHADTLEDSSDAEASVMSTSMATNGAETPRQNAKERFRAIVAAKGASILEASINTEHSGRIASANFVLSVLAEESHEMPGDARMMKGTDMAPEAMLFMSSPVMDTPVESLEELSKKAKRAFGEATLRVEAGGSEAMREELSALLPILVQAEAELITGKEDDARSHFTAVIDGAAMLGASEPEPQTPEETSVPTDEGEGLIDSILPN